MLLCRAPELHANLHPRHRQQPRYDAFLEARSQHDGIILLIHAAEDSRKMIEG
jgi:hypothetical protein